MEHRSLTLGEVLDGDRMAVAMHEIRFKGNKIKNLNKLTDVFSLNFHKALIWVDHFD